MFRLVPLFIIGFWATMTGLLVKRTLWPESLGAAVATEEVFKLFFENVKDAPFTQVVIYQNDEKVGLGSITAKPTGENGESGNIRAVGHARIADNGTESGVLLAWDGQLQLRALEQMESFQVRVDVKEEDFIAQVKVEEGKPASFRVAKDGKVLADSNKGLFRFLGAGLLTPGSGAQIPSTIPGAKGDTARPVIQATSQVREIAGRQRGVYVVDVKPSAQVAFSMVFTDMGEFVLLRGFGDYEMRSALFDGLIDKAEDNLKENQL